MPSLNSIPPTRKEGIKKTLASGKWCCNTEGKRRESQHGGERRPGAQQRPLWAQLESLGSMQLPVEECAAVNVFENYCQ